MKKIVFSFLLLIAVSVLHAQPWSPLGPNDENQLSKNRVDYLVSAADNNGVLHAVFQDERSQKLTLRKWTGTAWVNIGNPEFTPGAAYGCSMVFNQNNVPFVVFANYAESKRLSVMRFVNNAWSYAGQVRISNDDAGFSAIAIDSLNRPIIAYNDFGDGKLYVKMLISGTWQNVGSGTLGLGDMPFLNIDEDNHPIIAYDEPSTPHLVIMKFVNGAWQDISDTTIQFADYFSMAAKKTGGVFCAYADGNSDTSKLVLKSYNNGIWQNIPVDLGGDTIGMLSNIVFDNQDKLHIVNLANTAINYYSFDGKSWQKHNRVPSNFTLYNHSLTLQNHTTPALFFQDVTQGGKPLCRVFNGVTWPYLGQRGFANNQVSNIKAKSDYLGNVFALMQTSYTYSNPYYGFYERTELKKFDGVNWLPVGDSAYSLGNGEASDLAIDTNGIPWVASDPSQIRVSKLNSITNNTWVDVNSIDLESAWVEDVNIEISTLNTPFVCYHRKFSDSIQVKKYVNNAWVRVGTSFLPEKGQFIKMVLDGENPVISFYNNAGMRVYKLISNTWVLQGNPAIFLPYSNYAYDLGVSNGEVYIAYPEFANVSVKKFNGSQWSYVGGQGIAYSSALKPRMEFDDLGNLYVLFNQFPGYLKVKMFDGTNWNLVGTGDFSESRTDDYDIATFGNGTVAVVFNAGGAFAKAVGPSVGVDEELNEVPRVAAVYPNPSSGMFNVEFLSPNDVEFTVTDIVGRLVVEGKVQRGTAIINLSRQATGVYVLRFEDGYSIKLIKQ